MSGLFQSKSSRTRCRASGLAGSGLSGLVLLGLIASASGCATVAVAPMASISQISLTSPQSELRREAAAFCQKALGVSWASEGDAMGQLAGAMLGPDASVSAPAETYAERLTREGLVGPDRQARARQDGALLSARLDRLNARALDVLADSARAPDREDVIAFERALVLAQQARQSIAEVLAEPVSSAATRPDTQEADAALLGTIDLALDQARLHAEALSLARAEPSGV